MDADADAEVDAYALLGVAAAAGERELSRAYRAKALQHHPDKNRGDPAAARLFHDVKAAYDLLSDPVRRAAYDERRRALLAKRQRLGALSSQRKRMKSQLERGEQAARDARDAERERAQAVRAEAARFRDEALRDEARRDRAMRDHVRHSRGRPDGEPADDLDRAVRVRWATGSSHDRASLAAAFAPFGALDEVVVAPAAGPRSALLVFRSAAAARALLAAGSADPRISGFECAWAAGARPAETLAGPPPPPPPPPAADERRLPGSGLAFADFEALTLERMRQAGAAAAAPPRQG
ncbi:hypothetical protein H4R18_000549 [Coemansia javaensis]|uniref:J domain-containing protein n=1 Tax=Coemansia javaensis TaxID=2761396 RepID=A0A9W8HI27_9FUNG|nr:hypothetical protein H4R18_000549 [Coemansia javaensis]